MEGHNGAFWKDILPSVTTDQKTMDKLELDLVVGHVRPTGFSFHVEDVIKKSV